MGYGRVDEITYDGSGHAYINLIDAPLVHDEHHDHEGEDTDHDHEEGHDVYESIDGMIEAITSTDRFAELPELIREDISNDDYHAGGFISRVFTSSTSMQIGGYGIAQGAKIENASGGNGDDILIGNDYQNTLSGSGGDDLLYGGEGSDFLYGGLGDDYIWGATGKDMISAGDGDDVIDGGAERDVINGGGGNDVITDTDAARDIIWGDHGFDTVSFEGTGQQVIVDLTVHDGATNFNDYLHSIENITGTDFNDVVAGNDERNVLKGQGGDDYLDGGSHADILYGGDGVDTLLGGANSDQIFGGTGNDLIDGGTAKDILNGDNGDDIIFDTDNIRDIIYGGSGCNSGLIFK